jgi:tetratricopeptide (TPR) repeat protein
LLGVSVNAREPEPREVIKSAREMSKKGAHAFALELYLKNLEKLDSLKVETQKALLQGIFDASLGLLDQKSYQSAIRGLVALLAPTRSGIMASKLGIRVRSLLDQTSLGLVIEGQANLAISALDSLMEDGPGGPLRWALLVRAYLEIGIHAKAKSTLYRALSLHPDAPELLFARASLAATLAKQAVSRSAYSRAESLLQEAATDLEKAVTTKSHAAGIHRALGKIKGSLWIYYQATGQYPRNTLMLQAAEEAYSEAARLDIRDPQAPFELGRLMFTAGDWVWAEVWFREASKRIKSFLALPDLPAPIRSSTLRRLEECRHFLASTYYHRAVDAANTGHFELARELVSTASKKVPAYSSRASELLTWLAVRRRSFQKEIDRLSKMPESGDAQTALGDLWMRVRDYPRAREAYSRALSKPLKAFTTAQVEDRLFGARQIQEPIIKTTQYAGELQVGLEVPKSLDRTYLQSMLHKAHAITMGYFPHRLKGPLGLKVFPNRRSYLSLAGPRVNAAQGGFYVYGRITTFQEPGRSRTKWLTILVHEITHRYVDEMTYHQAPRWLYEGIALLVSQRWSRADQTRLQKLAAADRLHDWNDLEELFVRNWNQPKEIDRLYLQAHHMVHWLVSRQDFDRIIILLAILRDGRPLEQAMAAAFGKSPEKLQELWLEELKR